MLSIFLFWGIKWYNEFTNLSGSCSSYNSWCLMWPFHLFCRDWQIYLNFWYNSQALLRIYMLHVHHWYIVLQKMSYKALESQHKNWWRTKYPASHLHLWIAVSPLTCPAVAWPLMFLQPTCAYRPLAMTSSKIRVSHLGGQLACANLWWHRR